VRQAKLGFSEGESPSKMKMMKIMEVSITKGIDGKA
jgi:hypothetical protein